jgi:phage-related protein
LILVSVAAWKSLGWRSIFFAGRMAGKQRKNKTKGHPLCFAGVGACVAGRAGTSNQHRNYQSICIFYKSMYIIEVMKTLEFMGSSLVDLSHFPEDAKRIAGFELWQVQVGAMPSDFKHMPTVGAGAYEVRIKVLGQWRVIYVAKQANAVYVLHCFHKTTQKTAKADIDLAAKRYKLIGD